MTVSVGSGFHMGQRNPAQGGFVGSPRTKAEPGCSLGLFLWSNWGTVREAAAQ
jgi:hypothetical protein